MMCIAGGVARPGLCRSISDDMRVDRQNGVFLKQCVAEEVMTC